MAFFVYLETGFSSDAKTKEDAVKEATTNLIERLQRSQQGDYQEQLGVEWLVEEEE